ncbi:MAG: phosphatidate cytidylyltransferase, partial [Azovibrio sp.]
MFKTRVITAFLLLLVLIPAVVWLPQTGWAVLTAAVIALGGWEWGRLARFSATVSQAYAAFLFMVLAVFSLLCPPQLLHWPSEETRNAMLLIYGCATVLWLLVVPLFLHQRWQISGLGGALLGL